MWNLLSKPKKADEIRAQRSNTQHFRKGIQQTAKNDKQNPPPKLKKDEKREEQGTKITKRRTKHKSNNPTIPKPQFQAMPPESKKPKAIKGQKNTTNFQKEKLCKPKNPPIRNLSATNQAPRSRDDGKRWRNLCQANQNAKKSSKNHQKGPNFFLLEIRAAAPRPSATPPAPPPPPEPPPSLANANQGFLAFLLPCFVAYFFRPIIPGVVCSVTLFFWVCAFVF